MSNFIFNTCIAILLRLGSLKILPEPVLLHFHPNFVENNQNPKLHLKPSLRLSSRSWPYTTNKTSFITFFSCISTLLQSYSFLYHLKQVMHSGPGRNFVLLVLTLQRKGESVHKISNDIACI